MVIKCTMDISKLCRSCLKEVASWEKENFDNRTVEMFCFCTNITILIDEKLPKQFCYDCIIKIESCYTFIKESQNVDITLKNMASRVETSVIVEPEMLKSTEYKEQKLQLTLPDYKLSIGVIDSTNTSIHNNLTDNNVNCKELTSSVQISEQSTPKIAVRQEVSKPKNITKKKEEKRENVDDSKKIICTICKKSFISKIWFTKHTEKEHCGHKFLCQHCPKSFSKQSQLTYHAVSHSEERKFVCNTCGKSYKRRKQLTTHTLSHSDVRPYACDKCSMRFKMKSVLKCHMKVHEETKQYLCSYCGWSFSQGSNLVAHLRTHTGRKPHACACGFRAAAASSLRRHQRARSGQRPHTCARCGKGFCDASGLARHVRTHTGALPYECPGCPRAFSDSWKRKTHLMRAHRTALADIPRLERRAHAPQ